MKRNFPALVLAGMMLTACDANSFTVTMQEAYQNTKPVIITVTMDGAAYADLTFTINNISYTVSSIPTVSDPTYRLTPVEEDGMAVYLRIADVDYAQLHMLSEDGIELMYICQADNFEPLLSWQAFN